jgi:hypothetical protein
MAQANKNEIPEIGAGRWLRDLAIAMRLVNKALSVLFINDSTDDSKIDSTRYLETSVKH